MTSSPVATLPAPAPAPVRAPVQAPAPSAVQVLSFTEPLLGFPGHRDYALVAADAGGVLFWLQSVAPEGPRFLTVSAPAFFPDYAPALPASVLDELGLADRLAARVFCLVTVPDGDVASATANLRAPVVVDGDTARARQVVLTDGLHPIRRALRR
jgi:flagellar assembly factor FliW